MDRHIKLILAEAKAMCWFNYERKSSVRIRIMQQLRVKLSVWTTLKVRSHSSLKIQLTLVVRDFDTLYRRLKAYRQRKIAASILLPKGMITIACHRQVLREGGWHRLTRRAP